MKVKRKTSGDIKEPPLKERMDVSYIKNKTRIKEKKYLMLKYKNIRRKYLKNNIIISWPIK